MRQVLFNMLAKYICFGGSVCSRGYGGELIVDFRKIFPLMDPAFVPTHGDYRAIEKLEKEVSHWCGKRVSPAYVYGRVMKHGIMLSAGIDFLEDLHVLAISLHVGTQTSKRAELAAFAKKYRLSDNYLKWY